jgi:hypothetical protein
MIDEQRVIDALVAQVLSTSEDRIISAAVEQVLRQKEEGQPNLVNRIRQEARARATQRIHEIVDATVAEEIPRAVNEALHPANVAAETRIFLRTHPGEQLVRRMIQDCIASTVGTQVQAVVEARLNPIKEAVDQAVRQALESTVRGLGTSP